MRAMRAVISPQLPLIATLEDEGEKITASSNEKVFTLGTDLKCVFVFCAGLDNAVRG